MPIPEGYSIPITAPLYEGPTYKYIRTNTILCVFRTTKEVMEKVVPKPLVYNSDLYIYAWVNHLPRTTGFCHYREMFLTIPVEYPGKDGMVAGNYNAHLYLDNDSPIAAGREIYGYPKKLARVNFTEQEDVLTRSVERGGHEIFKVSISPRVSLPTDPIDPLVAQLALPFINYKLIPSVVEGAKPDVAQLTLMELTNFSCTKLDKGPATVEFNSSPADPLGLFKVEEVIGGWYFEGGYDLPYGSVLHDYLKDWLNRLSWYWNNIFSFIDVNFIMSGVDNSFDPIFSRTDYIYKDKDKLVVNSVLSAQQHSMEFLHYMPYPSNVPKEVIVETREREEAKSK